MITFTPKKLYQEENSGERLRQARLTKGLKIDDVSRKIGIRTDYLIALEEEDLERLPAGLYGKKFLTEYASFLGLPPRELLRNFLPLTDDSSKQDPFSQKIVKKSRFIIFPRIIRNALIAMAVITCFLYLSFYFRQITTPPYLEILQPDKNLVTKVTALTVNGQTEKEAEVRINGEIVLNNHGGSFSQTVNLKKGLNEMTITAKKKYSRENSVTRQILVED